MALTAKMRVETVMHIATYQKANPIMEEVKLVAVYSDDPNDPNHEWSEATPSGSLALTITNPDAVGKIEVGAEYFVEIRKART